MDDKTIKEIAVTTGKGLDVAQNMGTFIGRFVSGPLDQVMGMWEDKLKYRRWENQLALMEKVNRKMSEMNIEPTRSIPMKIAIPLLEYASVEDDSNLQEVWANLLINAANKNSGISLQLAYVEILKSLSSLEAQILQTIYALPFEDALHNGVSTSDLPKFAKTYPAKGAHKVEKLMPTDEIISALANLDRLSCLNVTRSMGGGQLFFSVNPTILGRNFVLACSLR